MAANNKNGGNTKSNSSKSSNSKDGKTLSKDQKNVAKGILIGKILYDNKD